jgi:hypothetical protein
LPKKARRAKPKICEQILQAKGIILQKFCWLSALPEKSCPFKLFQLGRQADFLILLN